MDQFGRVLEGKVLNVSISTVATVAAAAAAAAIENHSALG